MTDVPYNPTDPEFLASRSLDEPLSPADADVVRAFRESSTEAERSIRDLQGVDALLKQWGALPVDVEESKFVESVLGRIADAHADELAAVDDVLRNWRDQGVSVNEAGFIAEVAERVRSTRGRAERRSWIYRVRVPLSAAAAIGLVLGAATWFQVARRPIVEVSIRRVYENASTLTESAATESRVVTFDRTVLADAGGSRKPGRVSFMVIGTDPIEERAVETPPL